jgi:hypothetical protein
MAARAAALGIEPGVGATRLPMTRRMGCWSEGIQGLGRSLMVSSISPQQLTMRPWAIGSALDCQGPRRRAGLQLSETISFAE